MSSFVRAVLSASGALKPKEDLSATIARLQHKGEELKSLLRVEVESRYENLGSTKGVQDAIDKLDTVKGEMEQIWSGIDVEGVEKASEEMEELLGKLESLSGMIDVAYEIKEAWSLMETIDEYLAQEKPLEASEIFSQLGKLLEKMECESVDEDHAKAFSSIRQEYISSLDILNHSLSSSWDKSVSIILEDSHSILFVFSSSDLEPLISAMHNADLLSNKLKLFAKTLFSKVLKPMMTKSSTVISKSKVSIQISFHPTSVPSTFEIFNKLKIIFHLLSLNPLNITPDKSFIVSVSDVIKDDFIKSIINDLISVSVPDSNLKDFKENMGNAVEGFENYLKTIGFLEECNNELTDYINDIENIFVNKKLSSYLFEARTTIKQPLYETIQVSNDVIKEEQALLKLNSKVHTFPINEDDLPLPDKDIFKTSQFIFPNCLISKSVLELKNIIYRILDEAVESSDNRFLCSRLVQGSRYVFELYLNMINIVHEDDFNKLPQVSVVAHNDCFYLAHHCMLLGIHYRDFVPIDKEKGQYLTYIDFIPYLREMGEKILKRQIENQRNSLLEHVKGMDINCKSPEIVLRRISHGLHHLKKVWFSVLPNNVYPRIIGTLINSVLEELITNVIDLENIVADSALQTYNAFLEFAESLPQMFHENSQPMRYVRYWLRFKELVFILNANLREIEHRWAEGKGPLASEFSVDEIKRLIRAIFQNTERRATVLSRIKYES